MSWSSQEIGYMSELTDEATCVRAKGADAAGYCEHDTTYSILTTTSWQWWQLVNEDEEYTHFSYSLTLSVADSFTQTHSAPVNRLTPITPAVYSNQ